MRFPFVVDLIGHGSLNPSLTFKRQSSHKATPAPVATRLTDYLTPVPKSSRSELSDWSGLGHFGKAEPKSSAICYSRDAFSHRRREHMRPRRVASPVLFSEFRPIEV